VENPPSVTEDVLISLSFVCYRCRSVVFLSCSFWGGF